MKVDVLSFTQVMTSLLKSSLNLQDSLNIAVNVVEDIKTRNFIQILLKKINEGEKLSKILKEFSKDFGLLYISLVKIGEETGNLPQVFEKLSSYLRNRQKTREKIIQSLIYPLIVLFTAIIVVCIIFIFVFPNLEQIFEAFTDNSLEIRKNMDNLKDKIKVGIVSIFMLIICLITLFVMHKRSEKVAFFIDSVLIKIPIVGKYILIRDTNDFVFSMKLLISSFYPFLESLKLSANVVSNMKYKATILEVFKSIQAGELISDSFEKVKLFPNYFVTWIKIAEKNGDVEGAFSQLYDYYQSETLNIATGIAISVEPVFILLTGTIIITLIVQFVVPIFYMLGAL
nr:type II secretion system F family protein [Clostridia bacterium]